MSEEIVEKLRSVPIFEGFSDKDLRKAASWFKELPKEAGDAVTSEGESGVGFFMVLEGAAEVSVGDKVVRTLGVGDHFGEIALIDGGPRTATVTITQPSRLAGLSAWTFRPMMDEHPEMVKAMLLGLCKMVRSMAEAQT